MCRATRTMCASQHTWCPLGPRSAPMSVCGTHGSLCPAPSLTWQPAACSCGRAAPRGQHVVGPGTRQLPWLGTRSHRRSQSLGPGGRPLLRGGEAEMRSHQPGVPLSLEQAWTLQPPTRAILHSASVYVSPSDSTLSSGHNPTALPSRKVPELRGGSSVPEPELEMIELRVANLPGADSNPIISTTFKHWPLFLTHTHTHTHTHTPLHQHMHLCAAHTCKDCTCISHIPLIYGAQRTHI